MKAAMFAVALVGVAVLVSPPLAVADKLRIESPTVSSAVKRPHRGMTKAAVEARFGAPLERRPAVGEPPISRWIYAKYSVFFEHDRVIHSVVKRGK
ncbi:MAG: hypothetical protein AAF493_23270 [Pseudomonadota bacterium]